MLGMKWDRLREASAVAAALSLCLAAAWPDPVTAWFAAIAAAAVLVFAAVPLLNILRGRGRSVDWGQLAIFPVGLVAASCVQFGVEVVYDRDGLLALAAAALAILPASAAWTCRPAREEKFAPGPAVALGSAFMLALLGGLLAVPDTSAPFVTAMLLSPPSCWSAAALSNRPRASCNGPLLCPGLVLLSVTIHYDEANAFFGAREIAPSWFFALRWLAAALPFGLLLTLENAKHPRRIASSFPLC